MKILFLTSRVPYPLDKGDKLRAYNFIKGLSKNNEIILCAINDDNKIPNSAIEELNLFCKKIYIFNIKKSQILFRLFINLFSAKPFQVAYFTSKKINKKLESIVQQEKPDIIFYQLVRMSEYLKNSEFPKYLDYMDVLSVGIEKRIDKESFFKKFLFKKEFLRLKKYEEEVFDYYEKHFIITKQDRALIPHTNKDNIEIISNGVDLDYFKPPILNYKKEFDIVFSGNMAYPPNITGAIFLVEKIMPIVWKNNPHVTLAIVGTSPSKSVSALASDKVTITGRVDDVREYFYKSKIFVGPLFMNTGLQNKLLEAMACKTPCITTSEANNALGAKVNSELLIADNELEFADKIQQLLNNDELQKLIADKAFDFIIRNHKWSVIVEKLNTLLTQKK